MFIENRVSYAKIKILYSFFNLPHKRPYNIYIFDTRRDKLSFDYYLSKTANGFGYSKNKLDLSFNENTAISFNFFENLSKIKKPKPISLTYYLKD
jgi:hypothetical protein